MRYTKCKHNFKTSKINVCFNVKMGTAAISDVTLAYKKDKKIVKTSRA